MPYLSFSQDDDNGTANNLRKHILFFYICAENPTIMQEIIGRETELKADDLFVS